MWGTTVTCCGRRWAPSLRCERSKFQPFFFLCARVIYHGGGAGEGEGEKHDNAGSKRLRWGLDTTTKMPNGFCLPGPCTPGINPMSYSYVPKVHIVVPRCFFFIPGVLTLPRAPPCPHIFPSKLKLTNPNQPQRRSIGAGHAEKVRVDVCDGAAASHAEGCSGAGPSVRGETKLGRDARKPFLGVIKLRCATVVTPEC